MPALNVTGGNMRLITALIVGLPLFAHATALEDAINQKARGSSYCAVTSSNVMAIVCDGKDIYSGSDRLSLAMKLLIDTGMKPLSCNYARGDKDLSDVLFCALTK